MATRGCNRHIQLTDGTALVKSLRENTQFTTVHCSLELEIYRVRFLQYIFKAKSALYVRVTYMFMPSLRDMYPQRKQASYPFHHSCWSGC